MIHDGSHVLGLTTAATIWLVASIGMAVGTGNYFMALFVTVTAMMALWLLAPLSSSLEKKARQRIKALQKGKLEELS